MIASLLRCLGRWLYRKGVKAELRRGDADSLSRAQQMDRLAATRRNAP